MRMSQELSKPKRWPSSPSASGSSTVAIEDRVCRRSLSWQKSARRTIRITSGSTGVNRKGSSRSDCASAMRRHFRKIPHPMLCSSMLPELRCDFNDPITSSIMIARPVGSENALSPTTTFRKIIRSRLYKGDDCLLRVVLLSLGGENGRLVRSVCTIAAMVPESYISDSVPTAAGHILALCWRQAFFRLLTITSSAGSGTNPWLRLQMKSARSWRKAALLSSFSTRSYDERTNPRIKGSDMNRSLSTFFA
eukprot:scaffold1528_cov198-Pinguiococcus_pyrenoidosus.AAC.19